MKNSTQIHVKMKGHGGISDDGTTNDRRDAERI